MEHSCSINAYLCAVCRHVPHDLTCKRCSFSSDLCSLRLGPVLFCPDVSGEADDWMLLQAALILESACKSACNFQQTTEQLLRFHDIREFSACLPMLA